MQADIHTLLQAAAFKPQSLHAPSAWAGHLPFAWWLVHTLQPKSMVELGTHTGNSYFSFCQAIQSAGCNTTCYAVDTWQGDEHSGEYGEDIYQQVLATNHAHYAQFSTLLRMTFDEALTHIPNASVDLLHIDGLHTYEAVRHDFETWLPKLSPNATVLFHDTHVQERGFGVWQFWAEMCNQFPHHFAFSHSHGLGVLQVGHGPANLLLQNLTAHPDIYQSYFKALGDVQCERIRLSEFDLHLNAEKDNAQAQILYRDALAKDLQQLIEAEKNNAQAQILYRDALAKDLQQQLQAEKDNARAQILYRDSQVTDLQKLLQAEKDNAHTQLQIHNQQIQNLQMQLHAEQTDSSLRGLMQHLLRALRRPFTRTTT